MKTRIMYSLGILSLTTVLLLSSCQQEDGNPDDQLNESEEASQEVDLTSSLEDIDELALSGFQRQGFSDRTLATLEEDLCEKVLIEWNPEMKKMIIDFGKGCTSPRGVTRKGKMIITYTGRYWTEGTVVTTTFENFYVDERKIEGIRVVTNEGYNEKEQFFNFKTVVEGGKITWPNATFRTFEARHTKRIFLPTVDRGYMYALLGGSKGVNRSGKEYTVEITKPLITSERCLRSGVRVPSGGTMEIKVAGREEMKIDFGSETCDQEVSITVGERTKTINLSRS